MTADGRWVRLAPVPETNEERNGAVAGGRLYLFGGNPVSATSAPPGAVWEYNPASDMWTKKKNMPLAAHHVAVAESGGKIYVFGGGVQRQAGGPNAGCDDLRVAVGGCAAECGRGRAGAARGRHRWELEVRGDGTRRRRGLSSRGGLPGPHSYPGHRTELMQRSP